MLLRFLLQVLKVAGNMKKSFYITTAIDYANGSPHLGHAYEKVLTDVIARHRRLLGAEVYFLTGLDEHGQKVQQTARTRNVTPQELCDAVAEDFQGLCLKLGVSNNDYIRTTQERHKKVVCELLQRLYDKGEIYSATYSGYYSPRSEQFLNERDKIDGKWPAEFGEVQEITETNYFFKLSAYQGWLIEYLKANEAFIFPAFRAKQVLEFLKEPLNDLCISRPRERLEWGIPLPFDAGYVTYVWFDALVNYISAIGYGTEMFDKHWPADFHVIGKDILLPPHAVYWPIMLKALDIPLPKSLLVHGWWQMRGEKMSKSTGNSVNPLALVDTFGVDAFRYFLIREMNVGQDSDFSQDQFLTRYNSDLGNDLGNLVSRLLNMGHRYADGKVPLASVDGEPEITLKKLWEDTHKVVLENYASLAFHRGLELTFMFVKGINAYAEKRAPWKLAKSQSPQDKELLDTSLATMAESLRLSSVLLLAVMPQIAERIHVLLGQKVPSRWDSQSLAWGDSLVGSPLGEKVILFPRPQEEETPAPKG